MTTALVAYHGHCFDGVSSAAVVTRLIGSLTPGSLQFEYRGLHHQPGGSFVPDEVLSGDLNAVVDFRYTMHPKLDYWFDHHQSGLVGDEERAHFESDQSGHKAFDPSYGSCCKFIADVAARRFGLEFPELKEVIEAAHLVDTAGYTNAEEAVSLTSPAAMISTVLEVYGHDRFASPRIARLAQGEALADIAAERELQRLLAPLRKQHERTCAYIRDHATMNADVAFFDLTAQGSDRYNRFIPYKLFPQARYAVGVSLGYSRSKVSVSYNPWTDSPRTHNIANLCSRFGGGGHAAVGAVSLSPGEVERARAIAGHIAAELAQEPADDAD